MTEADASYAIAVCFPDGREIVKRGTMEGLIAEEIKEIMALGMTRLYIFQNMAGRLANLHLRRRIR